MEPTIPDPVLPQPLEPAPKAKSKADKSAPFTVVSTQHIVKALAGSTEQNRWTRLKVLARTNLDVAWLLEDHQKLSVKKSKKNP